jgi:acetoin utilization deacetylase AcuC-like enzyme
MNTKVAFHPIYVHPLPEGHRFPMEKYDLLPRQLLHEGTLEQSHFFEPEICAKRWVLNVHSEAYLEKLSKLTLTRSEERQTGFPLTKELVERELRIAEGTRIGAEYALDLGVGFNIAGGTHHAFRDRGEGFCLLNDQAIATASLLEQRKAKRILVVDLDVHQGNGTAAIFENDDRVFTFSVHGEHNYPLRKERSNRDVGLPDGIDTTTYLEILAQHLPEVIDASKPDFVFYQCGVDIIETDKLGRLGVSIEGCKARDMYVFQTLQEKGLPVFCSMGGGYSPDIRHIIEAHANTYRVAGQIFG